MDRKGNPRFDDLMFHRRPPCFFALDLLMLDGKDRRTHQLIERKQELRRLLAKGPLDCPVRYVDHVDGTGIALFKRVCKLDLEGIVAKHKFASYVKIVSKALGSKSSTAIIRRRSEELFERDRQEPTPGWHSCVAACGK